MSFDEYEELIIRGDIEARYFAPLVRDSIPPRTHARAGAVGENTKLTIMRAEAEGIDLECESDRNLVIFYAAQLRARDFKSIPQGTRDKLKDMGLLIQGFSDGGRRLLITERGLRLLEDSEEESKI